MDSNRLLLECQAVSAMAVSPWAQYPPRLAVAMRANKRNARVMVYEVLVGADAGSPFGSSALCVCQANIAETLTIKVPTIHQLIRQNTLISCI